MPHKNKLPTAIATFTIQTIPKVFDSFTNLLGIPVNAPAAPARERRRSQHFYYAPPGLSVPTTTTLVISANARDKMAYKRDGEQSVSEAANKEKLVCCSHGSRRRGAGEMLESY